MKTKRKKSSTSDKKVLKLYQCMKRNGVKIFRTWTSTNMSSNHFHHVDFPLLWLLMQLQSESVCMHHVDYSWMRERKTEQNRKKLCHYYITLLQYLMLTAWVWSVTDAWTIWIMITKSKKRRMNSRLWHGHHMCMARPRQIKSKWSMNKYIFCVAKVSASN